MQKNTMQKATVLLFLCSQVHPQPTDIFGRGAKYCNFLLYLTTKCVFKNLRRGAIAQWQPLVADLYVRCL